MLIKKFPKKPIITNVAALSSVSGTAAVTLNPSDKGANVTLSGGDLTATNTTTRGNARSTTSHSSGKYYLEFTCTTGSNGFDLATGIANSSASLTTGPGWVGFNSVAKYNGADVLLNNVTLVTSTSSTPASLVCIAVDLDNNRIWYRVGSGIWNNNGANDPATNTGGGDISTMTGPFFVIISVEDTGAGDGVLTVNFGATAFAHTAPSGFGNW